ncbi:hypothetical protein MXD61_11360 [Frankia sp. AgPm24]|uniref:hypothetical protein n=1 Tax=Frankia sp. AgPm24 TaxID=631128 RepID=UPI0020103A62|nr:hypothetical protein [Frankia sp. AgPm24]MCK9922470.1 hypothetical protein [Frankia sp. AgPm24]
MTQPAGPWGLRQAGRAQQTAAMLTAWAGADPGRRAAVRMLVADQRLMRSRRAGRFFLASGPDLTAITAALTGRRWWLRRGHGALAFLVQVEAALR